MNKSSGKGEPLLTIEEYAKLPEDPLWRYELVRGRLVREPRPVDRHGWVVMKLGHYLLEFVERTGAGFVLTESGFVLSSEPPTIRGPDVSFIARARVPGFPSDWFLGLAPDLAVEVTSRWTRAGKIRAKALEYLDAGSQLAWVVDPNKRTVAVYRSASDVDVLHEDDVLDGGNVLPGFQLPLKKLFTV
jgi:Uma2 family endonuclease